MIVQKPGVWTYGGKCKVKSYGEERVSPSDLFLHHHVNMIILITVGSVGFF